ncbi:hypothetical protein PILCRDRAFT_827433 [Piloderma croceum F 1598]|uniref:Uncharacterized protein n=1 Tax=Piloderma croceum (strain F 1598) TaxID=765440 RepID=A0A0C3AN60_PILCF|nr:hypothetical protein PILCRDRAFT_827433 [Piloderma croceum F 1598]
MIVLHRAPALKLFVSSRFTILKRTANHRGCLAIGLGSSICPTVLRSFVSSGRVANKSPVNAGDPRGTNKESNTYVDEEYFAGPFDTQQEAMLKAFNQKDWTVRVVQLDNGIQALETGGRISSYINPNGSGGLKDRLVDKRLVDDFGVWNVNELTEGQLADYYTEQDSRCITTKKIGGKWFLVYTSEYDMDEEDEIEDELDLKDEGTVDKP